MNDWETIEANNEEDKPETLQDETANDTMMNNQKGTQDEELSDMQQQRQAGSPKRL